MKESKKFVLSLGLLFASSFTIAVATPCACGEPVYVPSEPVTSGGGGLAFAQFGNGAQFTWSNYVAPTISFIMNGTTTTVVTTPGYFKTSGGNNITNSGKFIFTKDLFTWNQINSISLDVAELNKVLVTENFLPANSMKTVYDIEMRVAVEKFQKAHNIKPAPQYVYGYFGPITRAFINNR